MILKASSVRVAAFAATLVIGLLPTIAVFAERAPDAYFGSSLSAVPILFNDRHIDAKGDTLRNGRVLAAFARGQTVLVPLQAMFEAMGAHVSIGTDRQTFTIRKSDTTLVLVLDKPIIEINGLDRPLDVAPTMYNGIAVVPLRVISEGLGAFVQWLPAQQEVVVRYEAQASAAPSQSSLQPIPGSAEPTQAPASTPAPKRPRLSYERFISADAAFAPNVHNELAAGGHAGHSYDVKGAAEFRLGSQRLYAAGDFRQYQYHHGSNLADSACTTSAGSGACATVVGNDPIFRSGLCGTGDPGCVTVIGAGSYRSAVGSGQAYVPAFLATDRDFDARIGIKVLNPRVYLGAGYLIRKSVFLGYPTQYGLGLGLEKLPDFENRLSLFGSYYYYPKVHGIYTGPTSALLGSLSGAKFDDDYSVQKYEVGAVAALGKTHYFLQTGLFGDRGNAKLNAPTNFTHNALFLGGGYHF